jgi:hypothetical protein
MQGSRTGIALALAAALGCGALTAGCGNGSDGSPLTVKAAVIDSFDGTAAAWTPFESGGSTISTASAPLHTDGENASTELTYSVATGGSAGLERNFSSPQDWSESSALTLWVYGRGTGHTFLVQVYDAGYERWATRFKVDFTGWKQISIPFGDLSAAAWQPPSARVDGVRDFAGVNGLSLAPSDGAGSGSVNLDELALGDGSSATPSGATPSGATPPGATPPGGGGTSAPVPPGTMPTTTPATPTMTPTATPTPSATPSPPASTPAAPTAAPAGPVTGTIIPLYTAPSDPSWDEVAAAKAAHPSVPVLAVINPANGPGAASSPDYAAGVAKLTAAGVKVIGYVHTLWGKRPAAELQAEMGQWKSWYPGVSGIFFDEMASQTGEETYYKDLSSYAKGQGFDFTIGNPGQDTSPTYVGTEDVILIYENSGVPSVAAITGWHTTYGRNNFGVIPYAVSSLDAAFVQSAKPYVAYIYMQSDGLPNPWDSTPAYLSALIGALG